MEGSVGLGGCSVNLKCYDANTPKQYSAQVTVVDAQGNPVGKTTCRVAGQINVLGQSEEKGAGSCVVTNVKGEPLYVDYDDKPSISQEAQPKKPEPSLWEKVIKWFTE